MENHALALLENQSKVQFALVNAKTISFLTIRVIALLAAAMKSFPMEPVFAQLDFHATHVEFALFNVEQDNLCSKVHVQYALLTLSSTPPSMAAVVLKDSIWIRMEFAKNYK